MKTSLLQQTSCNARLYWLTSGYHTSLRFNIFFTRSEIMLIKFFYQENLAPSELHQRQIYISIIYSMMP